MFSVKNKSLSIITPHYFSVQSQYNQTIRKFILIVYILYMFVHIKNTYFQEHQWAFAIHLFSLTAICQIRIYLFCFFVSSNSHTSFPSFLQTGTWNLSNYSGRFSKFSLPFQNIEVTFERYSTKIHTFFYKYMLYKNIETQSC